MKRTLWLAALLALALSVPQAGAADTYYSQISSADRLAPESSTIHSPNLVSFGLGWFEGDDGSSEQAVDVRAEYRWGMSLVPTLFSGTRSWDRYVQVHPLAGLETSSRAQLFAFGGLGADVFLFENLILTPSLAIGIYGHGDGKDLGDVLEFRPQIELGYRFQNLSRVSLYYNYMSNWGIGDTNPGASALGVYLHVPTTVMFGR